MKEQFVTYEIALKLKELGFDEECLGAYIPDENNYLEIGGIFKECKSLIKAPLWQQAIDWLNSKNLYIFFYRGENSKHRNVFTFCILNTHYTLVDFDFENGDSDFYIIREQAIKKAIEIYQRKS